MEIILTFLILFAIGFMLGTFYLHIKFWDDVIGTEDYEKNIIISLFTPPLFPIFGTIELIRRWKNEN